MALAGDHVQVLVGGYELTGDTNKIGIDDSRKLLDTTSFGMASERYIAGQRSMMLAHNGYLNPETSASHPVMQGVAVDGVVSVLIGQNAEPVIGDPVYNLLTIQQMYESNAEVGQVIPFSAKFANRGALGGWGVALAIPVTITNSTTGSNVDNSGASSAGGAVFLHILNATSTDTYALTVEGSADGSTGWTQIATFTLDGSELGSERVAITGAVPRYMRYKATRTGSAGDNLELAVSLLRF